MRCSSLAAFVPCSMTSSRSAGDVAGFGRQRERTRGRRELARTRCAVPRAIRIDVGARRYRDRSSCFALRRSAHATSVRHAAREVIDGFRRLEPGSQQRVALLLEAPVRVGGRACGISRPTWRRPALRRARLALLASRGGVCRPRPVSISASAAATAAASGCSVIVLRELVEAFDAAARRGCPASVWCLVARSTVLRALARPEPAPWSAVRSVVDSAAGRVRFGQRRHGLLADRTRFAGNEVGRERVRRVRVAAPGRASVCAARTRVERGPFGCPSRHRPRRSRLRGRRPTRRPRRAELVERRRARRGHERAASDPGAPRPRRRASGVARWAAVSTCVD